MRAVQALLAAPEQVRQVLPAAEADHVVHALAWLRPRAPPEVEASVAVLLAAADTWPPERAFGGFIAAALLFGTARRDGPVAFSRTVADQAASRA